MSKDLTQIIERKIKTEENLGVVLSGLSASAINREALFVCGEITPIEGDKIDKSFDLVIAVYDKIGRVKASCEVDISYYDFFVLRTFEERLYNNIDTENISRILVYCKGR